MDNLKGSIKAFNTYHTDAYMIAVRNGFEGTEAEWLQSLNGEDGNTPTIEVERFENVNGRSGVEVSVTNTPPGGIPSIQKTQVYDGKNGTSAYATVTKENGVTTITTRDATGTHTAEIYDGGNGNYVSVEPAEDDIPKVFFGGALQQTKEEAVVPFRYISKTDDFSGYAEIKAQGNSSMSYPKKNQTVKMFADADCAEKLKVDFKGWGKQSKHVYKANWIDLSHARNVVSARLWADVVKSRANYMELPELLRTSPNHGAVDGFPVKVYADSVYQGRYTLNIPKDKWTFNMDDELDNHCVLCGENYASGCFRASAQINGADWTDEIHDTVPASIKTRWNEVISFVMNSTDAEFKANLGNYFYVDSLIDYYLFGLASCGLDAFGKNQIYATYDGQKWIASMYDMDSTWGLYWNGSKFVATDYARTSYEDFASTASSGDGNLLYIRLEQLFYEELQARWAELKNGALSITNIINRFERFTDIAPAELVVEDYATTTGNGKFTGIPSKTTNNIQQIRAFALARQAWTDEYISGLNGGGEEPDPEPNDVPCTGITLDKSALTFTGDGTQTLTATVTPDGCTDAITWESDNTSIATVNGGIVTAIGNGSANITARCGNYSASCSVTVSGIDKTLLYALDEEVYLDAANDARINTGATIFDDDKDFTLFIHYTPAAVTQANKAHIFHGVLESAPYPGMSLRLSGGATTNYVSNFYAGNNVSAFGNGASTDTRKVIFTHTKGVHEVKIYVDTAENVYTATGTADATVFHNNPIMLGGQYGNNRFNWSGTFHACEIWNRVFTADEIAEYLTTE